MRTCNYEEAPAILKEMMAGDKCLVVTQGVPGTGKSTLASKLGVPVCCADDYFITKDGRYHFDKRKLEDAHLNCFRRASVALSDGSACVANTMLTEWEMAPCKHLAEAHKARLIVVRCTHEFGSVHGVPEPCMQRMRDKLAKYDGQLEFIVQ